jgi:hypothetical protein
MKPKSAHHNMHNIVLRVLLEIGKRGPPSCDAKLADGFQEEIQPKDCQLSPAPAPAAS